MANDEQILYKARIHKMYIAGWSIALFYISLKIIIKLFALLAIAEVILLQLKQQGFSATYNTTSSTLWPFLFLLIILAISPLFWIIFSYYSNEFVITNKRVVCKIGVKKMDALLKGVGGITVTQSWLGRMLNYGTICILGQKFYYVSDPYGFKRKIEEAIEN
jgi:hypothetical protein